MKSTPGDWVIGDVAATVSGVVIVRPGAKQCIASWNLVTKKMSYSIGPALSPQLSLTADVAVQVRPGGSGMAEDELAQPCSTTTDPSRKCFTVPLTLSVTVWSKDDFTQRTLRQYELANVAAQSFKTIDRNLGTAEYGTSRPGLMVGVAYRMDDPRYKTLGLEEQQHIIVDGIQGDLVRALVTIGAVRDGDNQVSFSFQAYAADGNASMTASQKVVDVTGAGRGCIRSEDDTPLRIHSLDLRGTAYCDGDVCTTNKQIMDSYTQWQKDCRSHLTGPDTAGEPV